MGEQKMKLKDEVFKNFLRWKSMIESESGRKLNVLWSDMVVHIYTGRNLQGYLKSEGIRHVPKTPQQNGVVE